MKKQNKKTRLVNYQSNDISLSGLPLSEFQYNVFLVAVHLFNKYQDNPVFVVNKHNNLDFCNEISFHIDLIEGFKVTKDKHLLENNLKELLNIVVKHPPIKEDKYTDRFSVLFTSSAYNHKEKTISVSINPYYMFHFRNLKDKYNQYYLSEALQVPGRYAKSLYLALSVHVYRGEWFVSLEKMYILLSLEKTYKSYHIVSRVITPLQNFLKAKKSTFSFDFKTVKKNRKIVSFKFYNIENESIPNQGNLLDHYSAELLFSKFIGEFIFFLEDVENKIYVRECLKRQKISIDIEKLRKTKGTYDKKTGKVYIHLGYFGLSDEAKYLTSLFNAFEDLYFFIVKKYFLDYKGLFYVSLNLDGTKRNVVIDPPQLIFESDLHKRAIPTPAAATQQEVRKPQEEENKKYLHPDNNPYLKRMKERWMKNNVAQQDRPFTHI